MKKILFSICIMLAACLNNDAQITQTEQETHVTVSNKQLNGTKWKLITPNVDGITIEFSSSSVTRLTQYSDEVAAKQMYYYISDSIPSTFDSTLIGKYKKGSTIIIKGKGKDSKFIGYQVMKFDNDSLHLFYRAPHNTMFGGDELNLIYKRIK